MNLVSQAAGAAWLASSLPTWIRFRNALQDPEKAQTRVLKQLLARNATSSYGKKFQFDNIRNAEEFRERVPRVTYQDFEPWIERIGLGEPSVLTSSSVTHLIPTSGSTSGRKLIPFTNCFQREINAAIAPWLVDLNLRFPGLSLGTAYWSVSPAVPEDKNPKFAIRVGFDDDSGYLGGLGRRLVEATFAVPAQMRKVGDLELFRYLTLLCLLRHSDLRFISVWHPSFLTLLLDALPKFWEELIQDLRTGYCRRAPHLRFVNAKAQPYRAQKLTGLGPGSVHQIWPELRVVSCWGDAQSELPFDELQKRLATIFIQSKGLIATEAIVSIPFREMHPLAINSHFFEFIDENGRSKLSHELTMGESYSVVVTTGSGLWRYELGDKIRMDGLLERTPSIVFVGREGNVSDLRGEKLSEIFVNESLMKVCSRVECRPQFAMLAPDAELKGYILFAEGKIPPEFVRELDLELRKNPNYDICRNLGQLRPICLVEIISGAEEAYLCSMVALGQKLGDIKPKALSTHTDWETKFRKSCRTKVTQSHL